MTVRNHFHPFCHLVNGERLYFFFVKIAGDFTESQQLLLASLAEADILSSSYSYLVFGEFDFIVRVWGTQALIHKFEASMEKHRGAGRVFLEWRKLLVSRMSTWLQRDLESSVELSSLRVTKEMIKDIWNGTPSLMLKKTFVENPLPGTNKFFMLIEESYESEQRVFSLLERMLTSSGQPDSPYKFLTSWSLYSVYFFPEQNNGQQKRGVILSGSVREFSASSAKLISLSGELSRQAAIMGHSWSSDRSRAKEYIFKTVTYICPTTIKDHEGDLVRRPKEEPPAERNMDIIENLLLLHDSHGLGESAADARAKIRRSFIAAVSKVGLDRIFRGYFLKSPGLPEWRVVMSEIRLVYKFLIHERTEQFIQMLFKRYVTIEKALGKRVARLSPEKNTQELVEDVHAKIMGMDYRQLAYQIVTKNPYPHVAKKMTLDPMVAKFKAFCGEAQKDSRLSKDELVICEEFFDALKEMTAYRNTIFHGEWDKLIENDEHGYGWDKVVKNYVQISLLFTEVMAALDQALTEKGGSCSRAV